MLIESYFSNLEPRPVLGTRLRCGRVHRESESFVYLGSCFYAGQECLVVIKFDDVARTLSDDFTIYLIEPHIKLLWSSDKEPWLNQARNMREVVSRRMPVVKTDLTWPNLHPVAALVDVASTNKAQDFQRGDIVEMFFGIDLLYCGKFKGRWVLASKSMGNVNIPVVGVFRIGDESWKVFCCKPFKASLKRPRGDVSTAETIHRKMMHKPNKGSIVSMMSGSGICLGRSSSKMGVYVVAVMVDSISISGHNFFHRVDLDGDTFDVVEVDELLLKLKDPPSPESVFKADALNKKRRSFSFL